MLLLGRANRRHFLRHPVQLLLAVLGVALGVAMIVSIDLATFSAHRAFEHSMEALTGRYTHHINGRASGLPESLFARLRTDWGLHQSAPAVEGYATVGGLTLRLVGFDPFAERNLQSRFTGAARSDDATRLLTEPGAVMLSQVTAQRLGAHPGGTLVADVDGRLHSLTVVAYAEGKDAPDPALEGVLLADISTAQELLGRVGLLDRIDLVLAGGPAEEQRIRGLLPVGVELESVAGRNAAARHMTDAFELNLRSMSLLALLVGAFLIYNTIAFSVLQRRELLAALRILGATRAQLLREILTEAALLGLVGGLLGLLAGTLAAKGLLHMVTRTINDLYFVLTVTDFSPDPVVLLRSLGLGVAAALAAALGPALEAAWASPVQARARSGLETAAHRALPWLAGAGLLAMLAAAALLNADNASLRVALGGFALLLLGYGLAVPWLLAWGAALAGRLAGPAWLARLAVRGVAATPSRSGPAVAALAIAVAVSIGVGTMIDSFRSTVNEWLAQILQADIYVTIPSNAARHSPPLPAGLAGKLAALEGVAHIGTGRRLFVASSEGESELLVLDPPYPGPPGFRFKQEDSKQLWDAFPAMQAVFVSEPYAQKHQLQVGDPLEIATDSGPLKLPVAGIFFDYRSDQGLVVMHRGLYERHWQDRAYTSVGLYLKPGADLAAVREAAERLFAAERQPLSIRSNREIRARSMETFERTFAVTLVLRLLVAGVAFIGILSALLAFQCERRRELAVLRATGLTPAQAARLTLLQTGFMGLMAGLLSIPPGVAVALALVRVVNVRSFGWTMDLSIAPATLALAVGLSVLAALLAGIYPARQVAAAQPAAALREE